MKTVELRIQINIDDNDNGYSHLETAVEGLAMYGLADDITDQRVVEISEIL